MGIDRLMIGPRRHEPRRCPHARPPIGLRSDFNLGFAVLPGDVNGDGVVNSQDQVLVRNQIVGIGRSQT